MFTDLSSHWAKDVVDNAVSLGLFGGRADAKFRPDEAITRGDLANALGRMAKINTSAYQTSSFTDVAPESYYLPYIEWAAKTGIMPGISAHSFAPNRTVPREQAAWILQNYARVTGHTLLSVRTAGSFADSTGILAEYREAVAAMQQSGVMMSRKNNLFVPKAGITRAEIYASLYRMVKGWLDPNTAQGWAKNDDGQLLYYRSGLAVSGWQIIDGKRYLFDAAGILQTGWQQDSAGDRMYLSISGPLAGWQVIDGKRYYFTSDGTMIAGKWFEIDGKWYYFNADGSLLVNAMADGYLVDEKGARKEKTV